MNELSLIEITNEIGQNIHLFLITNLVVFISYYEFSCVYFLLRI